MISATNRLRTRDNLIARFHAAVKELDDIQNKMRQFEPDVEYYLSGNTLNLMKGPSHEGPQCHPNRANVMAFHRLPNSSGGDW